MDIVSITLVNGIVLSHCADRIVSPNVSKQRYYFQGGVNLDEFGVAVVMIVSSKEVELQQFTLGISN